MKTKEIIFSVAYVILTTALCVTCNIACTNSTSSTSQSTESRWKNVSSLEEFKQQFRGTTWESHDTYSYRIVVNQTGTKAELYFNLHMPDRDHWSLQCECITDIYEMYSMYEGDYIRVALKSDGDTKGSLHFKKDGTPLDFYDEKGGCFGKLHLVSNN